MRTIKRDIAGAFVFSADDKILLGKTGAYAGLWVIPGGGFEEGETGYEAARREVLEESNVDIDEGQATVIEGDRSGQSEKTLPSGETVLVMMRFFDYIVRMEKVADDIPATPGDDLTVAGWYTAAEAEAMPLAPPVEKQLKEIGYISDSQLK